MSGAHLDLRVHRVDAVDLLSDLFLQLAVLRLQLHHWSAPATLVLGLYVERLSLGRVLGPARAAPRFVQFARERQHHS